MKVASPGAGTSWRVIASISAVESLEGVTRGLGVLVTPPTFITVLGAEDRWVKYLTGDGRVLYSPISWWVDSFGVKMLERVA